MAALKPRSVEADDDLVRLLFTHASDHTGLARTVLAEANHPLTMLSMRLGAEAVGKIAQRLGMSHWAVLRYGACDQIGRVAFAAAAADLSVELMRLAKVSDLASLVAGARAYLDGVTASVGRSAGSGSVEDLSHTWWEVIYDLALDDPKVARALADFNDASVRAGQVHNLESSVGELLDAHEDAIRALRVRGRALAEALCRAPGVVDSMGLPARISGVVRRMEQRVPEGGAGALDRFLLRVDELDPEDPLRHALDALRPAFEGEPLFVREIERTLFVIQAIRKDAVRGLQFLPPAQRRAKIAEANATIHALTWRVQGLLGEMTALSSASYRELVAGAMSDAWRLARELNAGRADGAAEWVARRVRRVRAPAGESGGMAMFYDDVVVLVREGKDGALGEAHVLLATQVKSGDFSSAQILDQVVSDLGRELKGRIELDGVYYEIVTSAWPIQRVCVLTSLPPRELASLLPDHIELRSHGTNGRHFADLARAVVAILAP